MGKPVTPNQHTKADTQQTSVLDIQYFPIRFSDDLPITMHYPHVHPDSPIQHLHMHDCWELGHCFDGDGIFMVGSKLMSFTTGAVTLIGPDEPHLAQSLTGTKSRWAWIYFDPFALMTCIDPTMQHLDPSPLKGNHFSNLVTEDQHPLLAELLKALVSELQTPQADRTVMLPSLFAQILLQFKRLSPHVALADDVDTTPTRHLLARLAPAMQYLARHYAQPLSVDALAQMCHVSESHFRRLFQDAHAMSPQRYWLTMRIRMAMSLLRSSNASILDISQQVGFQSLSSFNRHFREIQGVTPSQWRRGK